MMIEMVSETNLSTLDLFLDIPTEEELAIDPLPIGIAFNDIQDKGGMSDGSNDF